MGLSLVNLCSAMISYLSVPTMAAHAAQAYGAGPVAGGGLLQDRFGERMVLAPCLLALAGSLVAVADSAALLLAGAVAFGLSWGTMVTGGQAAAGRTGR